MKPAGAEVLLSVSHGELPPVDDLLITGTGRCYRVLESKASRPGSKRVGVLRCLVLDRDAVRLGEDGVWAWQFDAR